MTVKDAKTIGVISDTHGTLRPDVLEVFSNCDLIFHAGDIGNEQIIRQLEKVAPVIAVNGNCDTLHLCKVFPRERSINIQQSSFYITHIPTMLLPEFDKDKQNIVIFGHTHRPNNHESCGVLYINPGSSGPPRYNLPPTVMKLTYDEQSKKFTPELVKL